MFVFKLLHRVFYVKLYYLIFMLLNHIFLYVFLCRIVNTNNLNSSTQEVLANIVFDDKQEATQEVIDTFAVPVVSHQSSVKKIKAKKSVDILVSYIV